MIPGTDLPHLRRLHEPVGLLPQAHLHRVAKQPAVADRAVVARKPSGEIRALHGRGHRGRDAADGHHRARVRERLQARGRVADEVGRQRDGAQDDGLVEAHVPAILVCRASVAPNAATHAATATAGPPAAATATASSSAIVAINPPTDRPMRAPHDPQPERVASERGEGDEQQPRRRPTRDACSNRQPVRARPRSATTTRPRRLRPWRPASARRRRRAAAPPLPRRSSTPCRRRRAPRRRRPAPGTRPSAAATARCPCATRRRARSTAIRPSPARPAARSTASSRPSPIANRTTVAAIAARTETSPLGSGRSGRERRSTSRSKTSLAIIPAV